MNIMILLNSAKPKISLFSSPKTARVLDLREKLLEAEAQRLSGAKTYSLDEVNKQLEEIINGSN